MKIELEKKLKEKYPLLFKHLHNSTPMRSCMSFGLEISDGWFDIIDELGAKLEPIIADLIKTNPQYSEEEMHPTATQVKEKFGTLRFYCSYLGEEAERYIEEAEELSGQVCELCGSVEGSVNTTGYWLSCRCPTCRMNPKRDV